MARISDQVDLAPDRVAELSRAGEIQLVDVREPHEHEAGRIAGARHVELVNLSSEAESLAGRPIVFYCRTGARSGMAASAFASSGFEAYNLDGGLVEWVARGLPLEPEDGRVADH
jgi:rhodanese-related sulfurtransferase